MKIPVTVVVPTRNEESNLAACLSRLADFAAVWVVDSGSTDRTREIAELNGARVIDFRWPGGFPKKRNWILLNENFSTSWVLFLDADEHVTSEFCAELMRALNEEKSGYWLNYSNSFLGRTLKFGVPQRKLALLKVGSGLYERIDDPGWSHLDMEVHEHPQVAGGVGEIRSRIIHHDFRGIAHFADKHNDYSTWEAHRYLDIVSSAERFGRLTRRQKLKYRCLTKWWFAPGYFLGSYVLKGGMFDGAAGLHYALLKWNYFHLIKLKIGELEAERRQIGAPASQAT